MIPVLTVQYSSHPHILTLWRPTWLLYLPLIQDLSWFSSTYILHVLPLDKEIGRRHGDGWGGRCSGEQRGDFAWLQGWEFNKNTALYLLVSILLQPRDAVGWSLETWFQIFLCHNIPFYRRHFKRKKWTTPPLIRLWEIMKGEKSGIFTRLQVKGGAEMKGGFPICLFIS